MTQLKELYKGKSLDDLTRFYQVGDKTKMKLKQLLKATQKVYEEAEKCLKLGDEELSYIYFMKYFNLIDQIRKSPDYSKEKQYITEMLGGQQRQLLAMDKAEKLNSSLSKRYENLQNSTSVTSPSQGKIAASTVTTATLDNQISLSYDSEDDDSLIINEADSTSNYKNNNHKLGSGDGNAQTSMNTCEELYRMIQDPKSSLLIMDCRPQDDFKESRLHYSNCVNVPEEIILPGMSAGVVQQQLENNSKALWASRSVKDNVVLMDWNSQGPEPALYTPIWRLRDILQNWDPDAIYRSPIRMLQGGYESYILRYPTQCTNPNVQPPSGSKNEMEIIDDIEYPSINDIVMKDDINYGVSPKKLHNNNRINFINERPEIDRKSKLAALKTYGQKQQMLEILKEQELIVDKTLDTQKKIREAKDQIVTITNEFEKIETEDEKYSLWAGQRELIYNIMQLQCSERDYKLEIERLKEQLEEYKRREKELGEVNHVAAIAEKDDENLNLEEAAKRVEVKRDQIDDEQKKQIDIQENQKQLIVVRNEKRHLMPPSIDDDEISKPKIPQFDRSVKPIFKPITPEFIREPRHERDFSPVPGGSPGPGLTGLKNLGNTCYMNSIMQCLSNTTILVKYFKSNNYKKQINRSNKTKGKIVEEVAELIKVLWSGKFKCVASKDLRYVIGQYQQIFRGIEQQDSHEFLTILMDWLHSDLQTLDVSKSPRDNLSASEKAWLEYTKSMESYILRLFYGQIKSTVKCVTCSKESATYECFSNLSLELPPTSNRCELTDCLNMYFYGENINGWNCPKCKQKRNAIKKLDISKLPPILVIHLKRFYADSDMLGPLYRKKQTYVNFPIKNLDMKPYIAPSEQTRTAAIQKYQLYAISNHYGSMESGHYTAFCRSAPLNKWFKFDDQVVSQIDTSDVVSSAAYILFYTCLPETYENIE